MDHREEPSDLFKRTKSTFCDAANSIATGLAMLRRDGFGYFLHHYIPTFGHCVTKTIFPAMQSRRNSLIGQRHFAIRLERNLFP